MRLDTARSLSTPGRAARNEADRQRDLQRLQPAAARRHAGYDLADSRRTRVDERESSARPAYSSGCRRRRWRVCRSGCLGAPAAAGRSRQRSSTRCWRRARGRWIARCGDSIAWSVASGTKVGIVDLDGRQRIVQHARFLRGHASGRFVAVGPPRSWLLRRGGS